VANGTAYVGSTDGSLYAVDLKSGTQKWKFKTPRESLLPSRGQGVVYFGVPMAYFYAVDAATDSEVKFAPPGERRLSPPSTCTGRFEGETMPDHSDCYSPRRGVGRQRIFRQRRRERILPWTLPRKGEWKFQTGDVVYALAGDCRGTLFVRKLGQLFFMRWTAATGKKSGN